MERNEIVKKQIFAMSVFSIMIRRRSVYFREIITKLDNDGISTSNQLYVVKQM